MSIEWLVDLSYYDNNLYLNDIKNSGIFVISGILCGTSKFLFRSRIVFNNIVIGRPRVSVNAPQAVETLINKQNVSKTY